MHAAGDGGLRSRTQVVIIHATDNTASASSEASYATRRADQTSAHVYVDDDSAVQALRLDHIAYGALWHGNQVSVQLELCGRSDHISDATMRQAAPIVAEVCQRYGIPVRKISASQVRAGVKGICGHADITAAFPEDGGDHTDPGSAFPWPRFIDYVAAGDRIQEDDMPTRSSYGLSAPVPLASGQWVRIPWGTEWSDPADAHADSTHGTAFPGYISPATSWADLLATLTVEGMRAGDVVEGRLAVADWDDRHDRAKTPMWSEQHGRQVATGSEPVTLDIPVSKGLSKGQHVYIEVRVTGAGSARVTAGRWTIAQDRG